MVRHCRTYLLSVIVTVNSFALVLSKRRKPSVRIKSQINIVAALCLNGITFLFYGINYNKTEGNMSSIFKNVSLCMSDIFVMLNYYFMMMLLTIGRFLAFYLNMKHQLYLPPKKVSKFIAFVTVSLFAGTVNVLALVLLKKWMLSTIRTCCMYFMQLLILDILFLLYLFTFSMFIKESKKLRKLILKIMNVSSYCPQT